MKTLSYVIDAGQVIVTGEMSKGTFKTGDKSFTIDKPVVIDMESPEKIKGFFQMLLQGNHDYSFPSENNIVIDDIYYVIRQYSIESLLTKRKEYFPHMEPRNLFNIYKDFVRYHNREILSMNLEKKLNDLFEKFEIDKAVSDVVETKDGLRIIVRKYDYSDQKYPNFELLLQTNGELKFLNFLQPEGEYYSSGDSPLTREMIVKELGRQRRLLDKYDTLFAKFNNLSL
jgi:hypothetical protein